MAIVQSVEKNRLEMPSVKRLARKQRRPGKQRLAGKPHRYGKRVYYVLLVA